MPRALSSAGHHATGSYEPRQIREEAAVSKLARVVDRFWPNDDNQGSHGKGSTEGAQPSQHESPRNILPSPSGSLSASRLILGFITARDNPISV